MIGIAHRMMAAFAVGIAASLLMLVGFLLFARRVRANQIEGSRSVRRLRRA